MLMENSSERSGVVQIPKRKRSLDLKSLYKSRVTAVGESKEKVSREDDKENVKKKKKKRSRKEVSLRVLESDGKKSREEDESDDKKRKKENESNGKKRRKEDVDGVKPEQGFSLKSSSENKVLHGTSPALSEIGNPFIFPRRPRGTVGRMNLVRDQVIKPLGLPNSVDRTGVFNGKVIKPQDDTGTLSVGKDSGSNSKSAGKVGGLSVGKVGGSHSKSTVKVGASHSKSPIKVGGSHSKSAGKVGGSDSNFAGNVGGSDSKSAGNVGGSDSKSAGKVGASKSKSTAKVGASNSKSTGKVGASNSKSAGKVGGSDSRSVGKFGGSVSKSAEKSGGSDSKSTEKVGGSDSKSTEKVGVSDSKSMKKASGSDPKSTKKVGDSDPKPVKKAGGLDSKSSKKVGAADSNSVEKVGGLDSKSVNKVGVSASKPAGKVGGSSSIIIKQKPDSKSNSSHVKLKRKAGADEFDRSFSIQHAEKEDGLAVNNGDITSKKRRSKSKKETEIIVGRDADDTSKRKSEPSVAGTILETHFIDSDDEENLEQNAARMLSSRFDPSCTGFSSQKKSSVSQMANGFSFPVISSRDLFSRQATSSSGVDSASADDKSRACRARREDKGKGVPGQRRYFYEIKAQDLDPHWFVNRRIKVFWPLDESWYDGVVVKYVPDGNVHHIKYDDQEEESLVLQEEKFKILLFPSEVPGKAKSRRVSPEDGNIHKGETVALEDDDSCRGNDHDSEPIALWLARSSQRGRSLNTQRTSHMEMYNLNNDPDCESISANDQVLRKEAAKSMNRSSNGNSLVYFRKKSHPKTVENGSMSRDVKVRRASRTGISVASDMVNLPTKKDKFWYGAVDSDKQLWSIDHQGMLRLNVVFFESKIFRFQICLPVLPSMGFSLETGDSSLLNEIFMLRHGVMLNTSPAVILEMLFIDRYLGLRFLLFEGCMKEALVFVFLILSMFSESAEHMNGDMQLPETSIRFRLSSEQNVRKHHVFEFHSFCRLQSSRWVCLDSELMQHCLVVKQLSASQCTYDNIKELECRSIVQCEPHDGLELSSFVGFNRKFVPGILPIGVSEEARDTRISGSALSPGEVPKFVLSFSVTTSFFLAPHLQLLMKNSTEWGNIRHHDAQSTPESSENGRGPDAECAQMNPGQHKIGTLETGAPASFASSNEDLVTDVALVSNVPEKADSRSDFQLRGITVDIPSCDQAGTPLDGKRHISRQSSDVSSNVNESFVHSPNPTGSGFSWPYGRRSSTSSPLGDLSPTWSNARPKFMRIGFSNGPKRPRTQVQYTLPGAGSSFSAKQKMQNQRTLPYKRRRASWKRISDGSRSNQKNFDLIACCANVLVTYGDKGWREQGALIFLEVADHNEWRLAVKLSGITKYSYKVKHILQPGSTNRYSHSVLWKGGKDWVLEFPDRGQWNLFKELYEECYNRNIRAAFVKNIPIPGVQLIEESDDYETEIPFVRNSTRYIRQVQNDMEMAIDPSRILYDMDSDDEQWLMENKKRTDKKRREEISEEFLEKTIDMLEKVSYVQHCDNFTDAEIQELAFGMGSVAAVKLVYEHWREKRGRKGMPLIRHLQPPLWERYQQELKEWEHTVARSSSVVSVGTRSVVTKEKVPPPEKPPMFAFCQKPRGLDVPNKGSKQRSHRKFSVSSNFHAASGDHDGYLLLGKRAKGHPSGDERVSVAHFSMSTDVSESNRNPKVYKHKSRKLGSHTSHSNHRTNQRTSSEGPPGQGAEQLDSSYLNEFRVRDAKHTAERAANEAKLKRDNANRIMTITDLLQQKAASSIMIAEASAAADGSDGGN